MGDGFSVTDQLLPKDCTSARKMEYFRSISIPRKTEKHMHRLFLSTLLGLIPLLATASGPVRTDQVTAELVSESTGIQPGTPFCSTLSKDSRILFFVLLFSRTAIESDVFTKKEGMFTLRLFTVKCP